MATWTPTVTKHTATVTNQSENNVTARASVRTDYTYFLNTEASVRLKTESGVTLITEQAAPGRTYTNLSKS